MRALAVAALLLASVALADAGGASSYQPTMRTTAFSAIAATGTATSAADKIAQFDTVLLGITYSGITGSPVTCTIQIQNSVDDSNYFSWGPAISIAPGASAQLLAISAHPTPVGSSLKYVYACGTYPTGGTLTLKIVYSAPDNSANRAYMSNGTTIQSGLLMIGGNDGTNARQLAVTTSGFPKEDLEQVAGLSVVTVAGTGSLKVGITGSTGTTFETTSGVLDGNLKNVGNNAVLTGSGATGTGSIRTTAATDSPTYGTANGTIPTQSALESSRAVAYGSSPTAVSAGNNGPAIGDLEGRQYVNTSHPRPVNCFVSTTATTSTQITGCEVVASNSIYITSVTLCGDIANATATAATLQSGTSTSCTGPHILFACYHGALGCCTQTFQNPMKATVAEGLCILDGVTGTKKAIVTGYVAP